MILFLKKGGALGLVEGGPKGALEGGAAGAHDATNLAENVGGQRARRHWQTL